MTAPRPEFPAIQRQDIFSDEESLTPPVTAADPHLLDSELDGPVGEAQEKHLSACGWCQQRADQAGSHPDLTDEDAFLAAARARLGSAPAEAIRRLTTLRPALHGLVTAGDVRDDVQPGQLWRLRWEDTVELAVVLAIDMWWVTIAPVTSDVAAGDNYSPLLPPEATELGVPMAVCVSLECVVPLFTFDQLIASAGRSSVNEGAALDSLPTPQMMGDVWRAWRRGGAPPAELTYGEDILEGDLDRRELRDTLAAGYRPLVSASAASPGEQPSPAPAALSEMLTALNLPPSELSRRSGLKPEVFLRVKQGGRVTFQEVEAIALLLDTDRQTVLAANPPLDEGLFTQVSRPIWRSSLRRLAEHRQTSEAAQRWRIAEAVAAGRQRTTPPEKSSIAQKSVETPSAEWEPLVQMRLKAELAALSESAPDPSLPSSTGPSFDHGK